MYFISNFLFPLSIISMPNQRSAVLPFRTKKGLGLNSAMFTSNVEIWYLKKFALQTFLIFLEENIQASTAGEKHTLDSSTRCNLFVTMQCTMSKKYYVLMQSFKLNHLNFLMYSLKFNTANSLTDIP